MKTVFVLQHEYVWCGRDEVKFIGVYASAADAEAAIARLRLQPGFCDWPDGFTIDEYEIGRDHWIEGFIKAVKIFVPLNQSNDEYEVVEAAWRPGDLYRITLVSGEADLKFQVGDLVRCEEKNVPKHGVTGLVATERVTDD